MTLKFDTARCADEQAVTTGDAWPITRALVLATVAVGMPWISDANARRFTARLLAWQRVHGPLAVDDDGRPIRITLEHVRQRIGLGTNAQPVGDRRFQARLIRHLMAAAQEQVMKQEVNDDVPGDSAEWRDGGVADSGRSP